MLWDYSRVLISNKLVISIQLIYRAKTWLKKMIIWLKNERPSKNKEIKKKEEEFDP